MDYTFVVKTSFWVGFLLAGQVALTVGLIFLYSAMKSAARLLKSLIEELTSWAAKLETEDDE